MRLAQSAKGGKPLVHLKPVLWLGFIRGEGVIPLPRWSVWRIPRFFRFVIQPVVEILLIPTGWKRGRLFPRFHPVGKVSCQRMFRAASVLWFPLRHAAFFTPPALCSRSVPSGQAMPLVLPLFRRRVSHAGRDGRLDERRAKNLGTAYRRCCFCFVEKSSDLSANPRATAPPFGTVGGRWGTSASRPGAFPLPLQ